MPDYPALQFWFNVAQVAGYVVLGIWVYWSNKTKATALEIKQALEEIQAVKDELAGRCAAHRDRTTALEAAVKSGPTHEHLGELHEKINDMVGAVKELAGELKGIARNVGLLLKHQINEGNK